MSKQGRKALEVLNAVGTGEEADNAKSRRSRRVPLKGRRIKRKIFFLFVILVLLAAGCFAVLRVLPEHLVPERFRERLDSLKSTLQELGLPMEPSPPGGQAPGLPARGGGAGETGEKKDVGPERPVEATRPLPIEK